MLGHPGVHRVCEIFEACTLGLTVALAHNLLEIYPYVSLCAATMAAIIGVHGVYKLIWRWWHGYSNLLGDSEKPKRARRPKE